MLFRALVGFAFPLRAGQHATHLARQVNAGDLTKPQRFHEVVDGVHPHLVGQRVIVDIAGHDNGAHHVHRAQPLIAVAAKGVAAIGPGACVVDDGAGAALAGGQGGQGHEGLVGGAWRVSAAQRTVEQRLVE